MAIEKEKVARAKSYLDNDMYEKNLGMKGIFTGVKAIYNPVPIAVNNMIQLSKKGYEVILQGNQKTVYEELDISNGVNEVLMEIVKNSVLYDNFYVELVNTEELGEIVNIITEDMIVDIQKEGNTIKYIKFQGLDFEGKSYTKEYFNGYEGFSKIVERIEGKVVLDIPMLEMRIAEVKSNYNIEPLLNKSDRINEFRAFMYNMSKANGDPMLLMKLINKLKESEKLQMKEKKYDEWETRVIRALEEQAEVKYIELTGAIIPSMQKEVETHKTEISSEYPEADLISVMGSSSNITEDTLKIKLINLVAKVDDIRENCQYVFNFIFKILTGNELVISFEEIFPKNVFKILEAYSKLQADGLISKQTLMEMLASNGIISSYAEEIKKIDTEKEKEKDELDIYNKGFNK